MPAAAAVPCLLGTAAIADCAAGIASDGSAATHPATGVQKAHADCNYRHYVFRAVGADEPVLRDFVHAVVAFYTGRFEVPAWRGVRGRYRRADVDGLVDGYALFEMTKTSMPGKEYKKYLAYGHPSGRPFDNPLQLAEHFWFLKRKTHGKNFDAKGKEESCICALCYRNGINACTLSCCL